METTELISSANQLTGFYIRRALVVKGLNGAKRAPNLQYERNKSLGSKLLTFFRTISK